MEFLYLALLSFAAGSLLPLPSEALLIPLLKAGHNPGCWWPPPVSPIAWAPSPIHCWGVMFERSPTSAGFTLTPNKLAGRKPISAAMD